MKVLMFIGPCIIVIVEERKDQLDVTCLFYFTSYVLNMFRIFIYPSSVFTEQDDRCGNSTTQSQAPDDGYIDVQNMLSTQKVK